MKICEQYKCKFSLRVRYEWKIFFLMSYQLIELESMYIYLKCSNLFANVYCLIQNLIYIAFFIAVISSFLCFCILGLSYLPYLAIFVWSNFDIIHCLPKHFFLQFLATGWRILSIYWCAICFRDQYGWSKWIGWHYLSCYCESHIFEWLTLGINTDWSAITGSLSCTYEKDTFFTLLM